MTQQSTASNRRVVANVFRGCIGNLIEWYDWFVYESLWTTSRMSRRMCGSVTIRPAGPRAIAPHSPQRL